MITTKQLFSKLDSMTAKNCENAYFFIKVGMDAYKVVGEDFVDDDANMTIAPRVYCGDDEIYGAELANVLKYATFA